MSRMLKGPVVELMGGGVWEMLVLINDVPTGL